eukprot:Tamp_13445.p1 GENE.Tamp_13445~~Tamp_13445.p1  ORF type:complete len:396 (-),score=36.69 Tamp_13445:429-1616(-)
MAVNHPGVGDPLGADNPYADGRPNWNLQSKARRVPGPADNLGSNWQVKAHLKSPYATDYPEVYKKTVPRPQEEKGMRHFESHLARTTREREEGGIGTCDHLRSGYDKPDRPTGRFPVQAAKREDPKDGGIWEPVKRQYPKVPRVDYGNGVRIVNKPAVANRPVDIWPATITVRDDFKPGGVKIFAGKRQTDKDAFPSAIGYTPPRNFDENGRRIDYSSVEMGGQFGTKLLHHNQAVPLPDHYQDRYLPDRTSKSKTLGELGELNKTRSFHLSGPQTGRHGSVFPFRPASAGRHTRSALVPAQTGGSKAETQQSLSATHSATRGQAAATPAAHARDTPSLPPRPRRDPALQVSCCVGWALGGEVRARRRERHTHTDRQTDRQRGSICSKYFCRVQR